MPSLLTAELVRLNARAASKQDAIVQAGELLAAAGFIEPGYLESLQGREQVSNTYLGNGVAIPHGLQEDRHLIRRQRQPGRVNRWGGSRRQRLMVAVPAPSPSVRQSWPSVHSGKAQSPTARPPPMSSPRERPRPNGRSSTESIPRVRYAGTTPLRNLDCPGWPAANRRSHRGQRRRSCLARRIDRRRRVRSETRVADRTGPGRRAAAIEPARRRRGSIRRGAWTGWGQVAGPDSGQSLPPLPRRP